MSVAFRRDSDEEHKEPRFELPIPPGPNYVTERGRSLIAAKVAELEAKLLDAQGDERDQVARDLRYWHTREVTAIVAPPPPDASGRVPISAPLARALVGAVEGDRVPFGAGVEVLEILGPVK